MNIEKNIPMPKRQSSGEIVPVLRAMGIGDSVVIPREKATRLSNHPLTRHSGYGRGKSTVNIQNKG